MRTYGHFAGGKPIAGTSGRTAPVFQPMTGEQIATVALATAAEVRAVVERPLPRLAELLPVAAHAAEGSQSVRAGAEAAASAVAVSAGKILYTVSGQRVAAIYRVTQSGLAP